jgi:hypothetical protein
MRCDTDFGNHHPSTDLGFRQKCDREVHSADNSQGNRAHNLKPQPNPEPLPRTRVVDRVLQVARLEVALLPLHPADDADLWQPPLRVDEVDDENTPRGGVPPRDQVPGDFHPGGFYALQNFDDHGLQLCPERRDAVGAVCALAQVTVVQDLRLNIRFGVTNLAADWILDFWVCFASSGTLMSVDSDSYPETSRGLPRWIMAKICG